MESVLTSGQIAILGTGAVLGGAIFGVAGFAFGIVASLFLHHAFAAADVIFIVVSGALLLNLGLLPRFWRDIDLRRAAPYLAGAAAGLPIGLALLSMLDVRMVRALVATLIIAYCLFALRRHARAPLRFSARRARVVDGGVGFAGGVVGGVSGLGPMVPGIWYGLRGMSKVEQRALTQPYALFVQGAMVAWLLGSSTVSPAALHGMAIAAPLMLAAAWGGLRAFDRLSTPRFHRVVTILALLGATLLLIGQLGSLR